MAEYIEREAAKLCVKEHYDDAIIIALNKLPSADVVPVRHGRWLESENGPLQKCSVCGATGWDGFYYCPNCGAKMDGEA